MTNQQFSAKRAASMKRGTSKRSQRARTARTLAMETGWPPMVLLVTVRNTKGTSRARSVRTASSRSRSMLPLKGASAWVSAASGQGRSRATPRSYSMLARVVSKWVLLGTMSPLFTVSANRMRSAARPWWTGMTWASPVRPVTAAVNRSHDSAPA